MNVAQYAEYDRLYLAIADLILTHTLPYKHVLYRCPKYAFANSADFLSGQGTMRFGTRYGAAQTFPIVYGSSGYHLALDEACEEYKYWKIASPPLNHVIRAFECSLAVTLDLGIAEVRKALRVKRKDLSVGDWRSERDAGRESLTQAIGRAAHAHRVQALKVPSKYSTQEYNVAIFPDCLDGNSYIR